MFLNESSHTITIIHRDKYKVEIRKSACNLACLFVIFRCVVTMITLLSKACFSARFSMLKPRNTKHSRTKKHMDHTNIPLNLHRIFYNMLSLSNKS